MLLTLSSTAERSINPFWRINIPRDIGGVSTLASRLNIQLGRRVEWSIDGVFACRRIGPLVHRLFRRCDTT